MQQTLLLDIYEWNEKVTLQEIRATSDDSEVGCFVEVDITYPSFLHDSYNDMPPAPETTTIDKSWISPYAQTSDFCGQISR